MKRYEKVNIEAIKVYAGNAKIHPQRQIDQLRASIREFGFINPILLDKDYHIIAGHGRYEAAKQEGMEYVPCLFVEDLTAEQVRAYRLIDNKLQEASTWSFPDLNKELADLTVTFNMPAFGFDLPVLDMGLNDFMKPKEGEDSEERNNMGYVNTLLDIHNLGKAQYFGVGEYDIPQIWPIAEIEPITEWIGFNYMLSEPEPETKGLHFFVDDYQFERVWNNPQKYLEKLRRFRAVLSPDFSPYGDMPFAMQLWNHYRKHWLAAYWQNNGITVIPTIRASTDPRSEKFYLDGEPENGIVAISSMWAHEDDPGSEELFDDIVERLRPVKVFIYGEIFGWASKHKIPLERIETFSKKRFKKGE